jgi:hypothetical protein
VDAALTLACALEIEEGIARRAGARTALVGLGAKVPAEGERLVSFGFCGALVPGLEPGALLSARRVVSPVGETVWEGEPLAVPGALSAVFCAAGDVATDPEERRLLAERTGAVAVDLESGALARSGRLAGVVRAVSDGADDPLGGLARAAGSDGGTRWGVVARAFVREPLRSVRTALGARRAMRSLERAAEALA